MKNQQDILKTLAFLNTKTQLSLACLSGAQAIFDKYQQEFFIQVCQQLKEEISHDDSLTPQEKRQARKLIKDPLEGVKNVKQKYTNLKSNITNYQAFLQKSQYRQKSEAISKSIRQKLQEVFPKDSFNQQKSTSNNVQNSYPDFINNFQGIGIAESYRHQGFQGLRSQDDPDETRELI